MKHTAQIVLFQSPQEPCSYLPDHTARNVYADPFRKPTMDMYDLLIQSGFRRSGHHIYRPHCDSCNKCVSVRIPVEEFIAKRKQKRAKKRNSDLTFHIPKAHYSDEYFLLYQKYLNTRHKNSGMDNPAPADFERFLISDWCDSFFCELRLDGKLVCVAVTDHMSTGLSAVYTFFDPEYHSRSLGNAAIMMQIDLAKKMSLPYLYLGYWIVGCEKMAYKSFFRPQERYISQQWIRTLDKK